jgi:hypothetical protein
VKLLIELESGAPDSAVLFEGVTVYCGSCVCNRKAAVNRLDWVGLDRAVVLGSDADCLLIS